MRPTESTPIHFTTSRQVLLDIIWEKSVLVWKQALGLIEAIYHHSTGNGHAWLTERWVLDVFLDLSLYIHNAKSGKLDISLQKHQKLGEVVGTEVGIVCNIDKHYSYHPDEHVNHKDSSVNSIHYKCTLYRFKQIAEHETIKKKRLINTSTRTYSHLPSFRDAVRLLLGNTIEYER